MHFHGAPPYKHEKAPMQNCGRSTYKKHLYIVQLQGFRVLTSTAFSSLYRTDRAAAENVLHAAHFLLPCSRFNLRFCPKQIHRQFHPHKPLLLIPRDLGPAGRRLAALTVRNKDERDSCHIGFRG
jgi:hypothetical protein